MGDIVSRKQVFINYSGGNFQLKRVKSGGIKGDGSVEVVTAVGVKGGAGFRDKEGGGENTLDVYRETSPQEVNWHALYLSKETFSMTFKDEGGIREQTRSCRVSALPEQKFDDQGEIMDSVTVKWLQYAQI